MEKFYSIIKMENYYLCIPHIPPGPTHVKALREQFGPTLSKKKRLCKKGLRPLSYPKSKLKYQMACQKKSAACHRFATPVLAH